MNTMMENLTGMSAMTDQVIATDMLIAAKSGIKNYAVAISECATPEVRDVLRKQLDTAIQTHEQISNYMISRGMYHAYNVNEQIQMDITNAKTAINMM